MNIGEQTTVAYHHSDGREFDVTLLRTREGLQIKAADPDAVRPYTVMIPTEVLGAFAMDVFRRIAQGKPVDDLHTVFEGFLAIFSDLTNLLRE